MKRTWIVFLFVLVAITGLVGLTSAARERIPVVAIGADTLFSVRADSLDSWKTLSASTRIPFWELTRWNGIWTPRPPFTNEQVYINDPSLMGISRWNKPGGAPATGSVEQQIEILPIPDEVKSLMLVKVQTEIASIDTVRSSPVDPLILLCVTQHDERRDIDVAKGLTVCKWYREKPHPTPEEIRTKQLWEPIDFLLAETWVVIYDGKYWTLQHYQVCNNIAVPIPTPVPVRPAPQPPIAAVEPPAPPPPPPPAPEPDTVVTMEAPPDTTTVQPSEPIKAGWRINGSTWVTGERVDAFEAKEHQWNGYAGIELAAQPPSASRLQIIGRFSPNAFGSTNFTNGKATYNARLGLRYYLGAVTQTRPIPRAPQYTYQRTLLEAQIEAGVWGDRQDFLYVERTLQENNVIHHEERTTPFYGVGPYVRLMAQGLGTTTLEAFGRFGSSISSDLNINVTMEPGRLYLYGAAGTQKNKEQRKEVHGQEIVSPWSSFTAREVRLGFKPVSNHILFASYSDWRFDSQAWSFIHHGPGVGWEWRIGPQWHAVPPWRLTVHVRTFHNADTDKMAHVTSTDRELRESITLTYSF